MCGIAGIFGEKASRHREAVARMTAAMAHRGPDGRGLFVAPSGRCVLGHRRLSIIDLTEAAAQPMSTSGGRYTIVYNGECYNYRQLRRELQSKGESFNSSGDTEVLLRLLARQGPNALPGLNAMFALALWDEGESSLLLARDLFGQKPLYYACMDGLFLFASEVRALLASRLIPREADPDAIVGYLAYGAVQGPRTIVSRVSLLPSSSWALLKKPVPPAPQSYWDYPTEKNRLPPKELGTAFHHAVRRHLISDAPLGLFLSGGIDSSAITAAAAEVAGSRVKTLCVVFPDQRDQSEAQFARCMADKSRTAHSEVPVTGPEMLRRLEEALDAMDQPTDDAINTYLVSYAARQAGLKVALSGLGGDELFGGYPVFPDLPKLIRLRRLLGPVRGAAAKLLQLSDPFAVFPGKIAELLEAPPGPAEAYTVRRRLFSSAQIRRLVPGLCGEGWVSGLEPQFLGKLRDLTRGRALPDAAGILEMTAYMSQMLLRDSDVMGMANGMEIRTPFLDTAFASRALALPPESRIPGKTPKRQFVKAMGDALPPAIAARRKRGFALPFKEWMVNELRDEVHEGLKSLSRAWPEIEQKTILSFAERFFEHPDRIGWRRPWSLFVLGRFLKKHRLTL